MQCRSSYTCFKRNLQGFPGGSHSCGTLPRLFSIASELHTLEIELYGTLFGQARRKLLLVLSNKSTRESNSHYNNFIYM